MEDYQYKKAGVIITEITCTSQLGIFDDIDRDKRDRLMEALDKINDKHTGLLKLAAQGNGVDWKLKQDMLSQRFTTNLNETIEVVCG